MLKQWRFKTCQWFAIQEGEVIVGEFLEGYRGGRARPEGMYIYKPSKRRYDYVDYTGRHKRSEVQVSDLTCILEFLGYIKFVECIDER